METVDRRMELKVEGVVQGVGFRPFIYRLAKTYHLNGTVRNDGAGVIIEIEGKEEDTNYFLNNILTEAPALANISNIQQKELKPLGYSDFVIVKSRGQTEGKVMVPPDIATCSECRTDLINPTDHHYRYPFTNCTNCGPRFTIVQELPYDRNKTSMQTFIMCEKCEKEYNDQLDRRFHAQPVACPNCGPMVQIIDRKGKKRKGDWLNLCQKLLLEGKIVAIKSLGGFHLACDAKNKRAIRRLRRLKNRPHKPLAIMCRDIDIVREYCHVSEYQVDLLKSPAAPIVVLERRHDGDLPRELSPGQNSLGVMLPYTPLHLLIMENGPSVLVMTSGNNSNMPICMTNQDAFRQLGQIADYFVVHDRPIENRCDDSVVTTIFERPFFYRRSRGYVPNSIPVPVDQNTNISIVGVGGDLKNTFCLLKGGLAYLSPHIGDLNTIEGEGAYLESLARFKSLLHIEPAVVVVDLHPSYQSSVLVENSKTLHKVAVQHHHAHMASCMAENALNEPVIGAILDGTGYGLDGNLWGFEILQGDYVNCARKVHLDYVPLHGGDSSVRNPWKIAVSYLLKYGGKDGEELVSKVLPGKEEVVEMIKKLIKTNQNITLASSCGRLFDAVAAILGICQTASYEGQAAIELGELVPWLTSDTEVESFARSTSPYPFSIKNGVIDPGLMIKGIIKDIKRGAQNKIGKKFHDTVVAMVVDSIQLVGEETNLRKVVLSGGCWQNRYLLMLTQKKLQDKGFEVYYHKLVPTNDGGLSLGQVMVGYWRCKNVLGCSGTSNAYQ